MPLIGVSDCAEVEPSKGHLDATVSAMVSD